MSVTVLGVRHHGPGSARAVRAALEQLRPDVVLIEGPPEADALVGHVSALVPPVALLAHLVDEPARAAFWPFAEFSPEWQALVYADAAGVPAQFIDWPAAASLAVDREDRDESALRGDPISLLSAAAGHDDPERWWEDTVEHRTGGDPLELFAAIGEVMTALRDSSVEDGMAPTREELWREACMRRAIRAAVKEHATVAVICGAWHVPALQTLPPAARDNELLRDLPKRKTHITWIPWTSQRLSFASGYGAGISSPGWYQHLWRSTDLVAERWIARVTTLLREADLPASPASAVEAVRLAEAVAAVRGRALPGLTELTEAATSVLCNGDPIPMALVHERLVVGYELGEVPPDVPTVPLQADFEATVRRLRFKPTAEDKLVELDLRNETDRARSLLLHRLPLLGVPWGRQTSTTGKGTFKEGWQLRWQPDFVVSLLEHARFGTTIEAAACAVVTERAGTVESLAQVTALVETTVIAALTAALPAVTAALEQRSARTGDVGSLMAALPPLARVLRYGDVRSTETELVQSVVDSLLVRIVAGLPPATVGLDEDAVAALAEAYEQAEQSIVLVGSPEQVVAWRGAQRAVAGNRAAAPLLAGRTVRLLLDAGEYGGEDAQVRLARALSRGVPPGEAVAWLDGFLRGSGLLLLRDDVLWGLLDEWLSGLSGEHFDAALPLLRRAFAGFASGERRQMGERARHGGRGRVAAATEEDWDASRVALVVPVLAQLLGVAVSHA